MDPKRNLLIGAAIGGGLLLIYGPGLFRWVELKAQRIQMESEIASLKQENQRLYEETIRLREDPAYAEAVARREMGFARPGETVVRIKNRKETSR